MQKKFGNRHLLYLSILACFLLGSSQVNAGSILADTQTATKPESIVFIVEPSFEDAITMLEDGDLDIFPTNFTDIGLLERVEASPDLDYFENYGFFNELTFNPSGPVFNNGKLNPFAVPKVREAMNYLIDRDHIVTEILGGLGTPRWTVLNHVSLDAAALASDVHALELRYAYNPNIAANIIKGEMLSLGAVMTGGLWHYNGEPVEIIVLIRIEDERVAIGDYVADKLEGFGFQVYRDYKNAFEASQIWYSSDPNEGLFHIYTGSWYTRDIPRDLSGSFAWYYTDMGLPSPLWQAYINTPEFYDLAERLMSGDYSNVEQRNQMMVHALKHSLMDSVRIFLCEYITFTPKQTSISLASNLYGGVAETMYWAKSIQSDPGHNKEVVIAVPFEFSESWNPIAGTQNLHEMIPIRGTVDYGLISDPFTGLMLPDRIERAEVVVEKGHLVQKTHDWVDLSFEDDIVVPEDAWGGWDAVNQRFIEISELSPGREVYARSKSTVVYPDELYNDVKWHDGSPFSVADIIMHMILTFDRAQEDSPIYDESAVYAYEMFMSNFKGVRIIKRNPLTIETYSDFIAMDAETMVTTWWPYYAQTGQGAWHALNLGIRLEQDRRAAFSSGKAHVNNVPWLDFATDADNVFSDEVADWALNQTIPFAPTLSNFIDQAELASRITNLKDWLTNTGHAWIGTGPYFLSRIYRDQNTLTLERFDNHPDPADRWDEYLGSPIPNVLVSGPDVIEIGEEAVFEIFITQGQDASAGQNHPQEIGLHNAQPYPSQDIERVDFFIAGQNKVFLSGHANYVREGHYRVVIDKQTASLLPGGAIQFETVVVSRRIVKPTTSSVRVDNQNFSIYLPLILR